MTLTAWTDGTAVRLLLDPASEDLAGWQQVPLAKEFSHAGAPLAVVDGALVADLAAEWAGLRAERTRRLAACDWTQVADVPAAVRRGWKDYRQALRDLPQRTKNPHGPVWPRPPEET